MGVMEEVGVGVRVAVTVGEVFGGVMIDAEGVGDGIGEAQGDGEPDPDRDLVATRETETVPLVERVNAARADAESVTLGVISVQSASNDEPPGDV